MISALLVALGGAMGACLRFFIGRGSTRICGGRWPMGTFLANMLGCFLGGILWSVAEGIDPVYVDMVFIGVLGSLTTFSTYCFEAVQLLKKKQVGRALAYIGGSTGLGLMLVVLGITVGEVVLR